jgi:hypothetical protein
MELLGHSSISLTMNTYGHILEEMTRETARQTDALFSPPGESHGPPMQSARNDPTLAN